MNDNHRENKKLPNWSIIEQAAEGYRYSIEPFLIADFSNLQPVHRVLDIGTGCGILPLLLAQRKTELEIVAVEIQKSLFDLAFQNIKKNHLAGRVQIIQNDFIELAPSLGRETFDLVISNPPYRKVRTGRTNPNREKAIARHEIKLDLESLVKHGTPLLKAGGRMVLAYPPNRLGNVLQVLKSYEVFPSRLRFVHGYREAEAKIFLVEGVKGFKEDCVVMAPLYVYNNKGKENNYTREMKEIYASFNYTGGSDHFEKK